MIRFPGPRWPSSAAAALRFLRDEGDLEIDTPTVRERADHVGDVEGGSRVCAQARAQHEYSPHTVPYQANLGAAVIGVADLRACAWAACAAMGTGTGRGCRTSCRSHLGRPQTYFDNGGVQSRSRTLLRQLVRPQRDPASTSCR